MYRSPLHDVEVGVTTEGNDQGVLGDFIDSVQRGWYQGIAGDAETINQLTGSGEGVRNFLMDRANSQINEMSEEGQNSLTQGIFSQDENGSLTLGEGAGNIRTWVNYMGQGVGTVASFLTTGLGVGSIAKVGVKTGVKMLGKQVSKEALEASAKRKAAELGFKGRAKNAVANAGISVAMGNGMVANGEREKYQNLDWNTLKDSPAFSELYWNMRDDPENEHITDVELGEKARFMLAEKAAENAFFSPKLTTANALSGITGALGGRGFGITGNVLEPGKTLKSGLLKGFLTEGAQEAGQGGMEQFVSNENYKNLINQNHDLWDGVTASAANEAIIGGVLGAASGGVEGYRHKPIEALPQSTAEQLQPQEQTQPIPSAEERAVEQPITGNSPVDTELNHLDDTKASFAQALAEQDAVAFNNHQEKITTDLLAEAAKRQSEQVLVEPTQSVEQTGNAISTAEPMSERITLTRSALVNKGVLPERNQDQEIIEYARAFNPQRAKEIETILMDTTVSEEDAMQLESEYTALAEQARSLSIDPFQTAIKDTQLRNKENMAARDNPARKQARSVERYDLSHANGAAKKRKQIREQVIARLLPEDQGNKVLIDRLVENEYRRLMDDGALPKNDEYQAEPYDDKGREFNKADSDQALSVKEQEAKNAALLAKAQAERNAREPEPQANPNWKDEVEGKPVTKSFAYDKAHQQSEMRNEKVQGIQNRIDTPVSSYSNRPNSMKLREEGIKPIKDFSGITAKTKGMSKRLRRKIQRAKGFNTDAVLSEFQNSEKRLQAYEKQVKQQARREAHNPDNIQRRQSAEKLFEDYMQSAESKQFIENEITQTIKAVNEQLEASAGTVLEIDEKTVSLPEVKKSFEHSIRNLANKFSTKTASLNEQIQQKKLSSEQTKKQAENENDQSFPDKKAPGTKIEDFGEELAGARKHNWGKFGDVIHEQIEAHELKGKSLSELVPKPNYEKLHELGVSKSNLVLMSLIRGSIPAKGRYGIRLQKWVQAVQHARVVFKTVLDNPESDIDLSTMATPTGKMLVDLAEDMTFKEIDALPHFSLGKSPFNNNYIFSFKKQYRNKLEVSSEKEFKEKALAFIRENVPAEKEAKSKSKTNLGIYTNRYDRSKVIIGTKVGSRVVDIQTGFSRYSEAADFLKENLSMLEGKVVAVRKELSRELRTDKNRIRQGENGRTVDVTPEMFANKFQFRGVQFGNWVEGKRRQKDLNDAYDSLVDLAKLIGVPTQALSLNGELGLAFGARGIGGRNPAAAHYEPKQVVINLTKKSGMGSLAHEWFHALDNYFGKQNGHYSDWITENPRVEQVQIREELAQAFLDLRKAVDATKVDERSSERDKFRSQPYWDTTIEKLARSFEAWVIEQNSINGITNDYLANVIPEDKADLETYPYPTKEELDNGLSYAFSNLFEKMYSSIDEETGRHVLYSLESLSEKTPGKGMGKKQAELFVNGWKKRHNLNEVPINVFATQRDAEVFLGFKHDDQINAFYGDAEVYLVAENLKDTQDLKRKLRHEVLTHYKLDQLMSDEESYELLNLVHQTKNSKHLQGIWEHVEKVYGDESDYIKAEEAIAYANEHISDSRVKAWLDRAIAIIAKVLRRIGLMSQQDITQAELNNIARTIANKSAGEPVYIPINVEVSYSGGSDGEQFIQGLLPAYSREVNNQYFGRGDFKADLYRYINNKMSRPKPLKVMDTPDVLKAIGVDSSDIVISKDKILKVTNGVKHDVPLSVIEQLPELINDPVAVFDPDPATNKAQYDNGDKNILVEAIEGNDRVMVALQVNTKEERALSVHSIKSVYGKSDRKYQRWIDKGLARYLKSKNPDWLRLRGLQLPKGGNQGLWTKGNTPKGDKPNRGSIENILTQEDIVKDDTPGTTDSEVKYSKDKLPSADKLLAAKQGSLMKKIKEALMSVPVIGQPIDAVARNKYALLTLRQIGEVAGYIHKPLGTMIDEYQKEINSMIVTQNTLAEEAATVSEELSNWAKENREQADKLFEFAHDATLADVDPSEAFQSRELELKESIAQKQNMIKEYGGANTERGITLFKELKEERDLLKQEPSRRKAHTMMKPKWARLSKEQKQRFIQMRDHYRDQSARMNKALEENITRAVQDNKTRKEMITKLRQRQERAAKGLYFPLARMGDYWLDFADENGERQYMMFETKSAMESAKERLVGGGYHVESGMKAQLAGGEKVTLPFVADVISEIRKTKMNKETADTLSDQIYQMYLNTLPARSLRKNFIHRKGVAGFSQDAIRVLADNGFKQSRQQARLDHMDILDNHLEGIKKYAEQLPNHVEVDRMTEELGKRHEWVNNPQRSSWAQKLTGLGFTWMLGLTPAAALVNLTQNLQVALPVLGSKHGMANASGEMFKASQEFLKAASKGKKDRSAGILGRILKGSELEAMKMAIKQGVIDTTQTADLVGLAENPNAKYSGNWNKAMNVIGWSFHHAEVFNREVTFLTSYRLNMKKLGDHNQAVDQAVKDTWDSHFDYTSINRARFMQSDMAAVALQFKQYSQNMTYYLWSNLTKSLKGESTEVKSQARKQLLGTFAATFFIGGAGALPLWAISSSIDAAQAAFGDDDDPFDAETEMKSMLSGMVGKEMAALIWYGSLPSISTRISLNDLWVRSINREMDADKKYLEYMKQALGPVLGGVGVSWAQGLADISNDNVMRGSEKLMPKAVKDMLKTSRYIYEGGIVSRSGSVIVDDMSVAELTGQAIGFTPGRANIQYDENNAVMNYQTDITDRRKKLMNAYYSAYRLKDERAKVNLMRKIAKFNQSEYGRKNPITSKSLKLSIKTRQRNLKASSSGIRVNPKYQQLVERYDFF
ncbi:hypothetical protein MACH09_35230 [Vibrio sp. MACH09]|nr:hypothetical protein MACH09_35230 [Vibrio sp. MACH09]